MNSMSIAHWLQASGAARKTAMDMHHIRYFLAVSETLNFTRAAEKCNVTQPALSRAVQQLEEEVGGLLFRRERNLTHLTDLGLLLKPRLQQIADELGGCETRREALSHS
jgi:LysR family hydrogen peroxide-inducible transcriptional activator